MFTGIIEEVGTITDLKSDKITIKCAEVLSDIKIGDSIAVNGVCLTVTNYTEGSFTADISRETANVTNLCKLSIGHKVNLERALTLSKRLGGHIVSGHIDTVGKVKNITKQDEFYNIRFEFKKEYEKYAIRKGSVAINGISLTIANINNNEFDVALIPHTYGATSFKDIKVGDDVNIEFDVISKYVEKFLLSKDNKTITIDLLAESGFC